LATNSIYIYLLNSNQWKPVMWSDI